MFKIIRKPLHLTQIEFAKSINVRQSSVSDIERGITEPSFQILKKVWQVYGTDALLRILAQDKDNITKV